jgi:hypothetical protein
MATRSKPLDVQALLMGAARLEVSLLSAGIETMQVYMTQASRFSELAVELLKAAEDDKASVAGTAHKLDAFGRQSIRTYADLAQRLSSRYYDELDRVAEGNLTPEPTATAARSAATGKRTRTTRRRK